MAKLATLATIMAVPADDKPPLFMLLTCFEGLDAFYAVLSVVQSSGLKQVYICKGDFDGAIADATAHAKQLGYEPGYEIELQHIPRGKTYAVMLRRVSSQTNS